MLFAGTTEGRKLCEYLTGKNCDTYVYVTTEYGRELLPQADNVHIHTGRMDEADMLKELEAKKPYIVIDATHPYATLFIIICRHIKQGIHNCGGNIASALSASCNYI